MHFKHPCSNELYFVLGADNWCLHCESFVKIYFYLSSFPNWIISSLRAENFVLYYRVLPPASLESLVLFTKITGQV